MGNADTGNRNFVSTDNNNYRTVVEKTGYLDPMTGNVNNIEFEVPIQARYLKLVWSSNTSIGGYGAQLSEIYVYGE